jgi:hypothetical protein
VIVEQNILSDGRACTSVFLVLELDDGWIGRINHNRHYTYCDSDSEKPCCETLYPISHLKLLARKITSQKSISFLGPVELAESPDGSLEAASPYLVKISPLLTFSPT